MIFHSVCDSAYHWGSVNYDRGYVTDEQNSVRGDVKNCEGG